jgi:hypothetical protein
LMKSKISAEFLNMLLRNGEGCLQGPHRRGHLLCVKPKAFE